MRLQNKVAIVTGGGTGIGEAVARKFAREGAKVLVAGLPDDPVGDVVNDIISEGGTAIACEGDLSEEAAARACVQRAIDEFGKLDVLVNNAGVFIAFAPTEEFRVEDFDRTVKNNVRSAFLMTKFALPHLQKTRGCVLFAGSEAGVNGIENYTCYGGTKAFLHSFMKGVAVEQAKHGVRANCVCPGPIDTSWTHGKESPMPSNVQKETVESVPLGRLGTPEEVANVYAFLASDEASFVTGAEWLVDGGITPGKGGGEKVPRKLRHEPEGELELHHQFDGMHNKEVFVAEG